MIGDITETILLLGLLKMLILVLKSHQFIFKPTAQVLTGRSGPLPARRVKKANLGLIFAACGGFCFSTLALFGIFGRGPNPVDPRGTRGRNSTPRPSSSSTPWGRWSRCCCCFHRSVAGRCIPVWTWTFGGRKGKGCQGMGHRWFWWWSTHKGKVFPDLFHWCFFHYLQIT